MGMAEGQRDEVISGITTLVYVAAGSLILIFIIGAIAGQSGGPFQLTNQSVEFDAGQWSQIDSRDRYDVNTVHRVVESTGYAIELTGADDSYWQSTDSVDISSDSTWTVCVWASVDAAGDAKNRTMTALSVDGRVIIQYNGTDGNWSAWFYDDGSTNSYRVNVSAPNQPGNLTQVCAWHDGSTFAIYRNATRGGTADTTKASIEDADLNASHWDGRQDEVRTFDEALNASQRNATYQQPVSPLANAARTGRIYFDSGAGTTEPIFFTAGSATLSNASWTLSGWDGAVLAKGSDYAVSGDGDGDGIRIFESSPVAEAPAVWVTYSGTDAPLVYPVVGVLSPGIGLLAVLGIVIVAVAVMKLLPSGNGQYRQRRRGRR